MKISFMKAALRGILPLMLAAGTAHSATIVTYVSGTGTNAGSCSFTAPCRTVQFALGQTLVNGAVHALDAADYGAVAIGRAVRLVGVPGASLTRQASAPVVEITKAAGKVEISGFIIDGGYNPTISVRGIDSQIGNITIKNCIVRNTGNNIGININAQVPGEAIVEDTIIEHVGKTGLGFNSSPGTLAGKVTRVTVAYTGVSGLIVGGATTKVSVFDSHFSHNGTDGIIVSSGAVVALHNVSSSFNGGFGLRIFQATALSAGNNSMMGNTSGDISGTLTREGPF